jgi:hypothetical protein
VRLSELPKEKLEELYLKLLRTDAEIASVFGVTQDAVRYRRVALGIATINPWERKKNRELLGNVTLNIEGAEKSRHKEITKDILEELYTNQKKPDTEIAKMFNVSDVAISVKRKNFGIPTLDRNLEKKEALKGLTDPELRKIYYNNTNAEIQEKLGVSKTLWHKEVKNRFFESKEDNRVDSYPALTEEQIRLIIGGLLGDGGIDTECRYYEYHAKNQTMYLERKQDLLKPYSREIRKSTGEKDDGYNFSTCTHPIFKMFRDLFYRPDIAGKTIPLEFIKKHWSDDILAYWFFDDGHFSDSDGVFTIANGCKVPDQLEAMINFLSEHYGCTFYTKPGDSVSLIYIPNDFKGKFIEILVSKSTPDLYYKIPEGHITPEMVKKIDFSISELKPKFVRLMGERDKNIVKEALFNKLKNSLFPYNDYTEDRLKDLLRRIKETIGSLQGRVIKVKNHGTSFCEYFFPNMWSCSRRNTESPLEMWKDI